MSIIGEKSREQTKNYSIPKGRGLFFPGRNKSAVRLPMTKYFYINLKINKRLTKKFVA